MDASSEIKLLKAKIALLETEKKHLIQKVAGLQNKKSEAPQNILSSSINVSIVPEENQPDYPVEQKIQLLKNIFRGREVEHYQLSALTLLPPLWDLWQQSLNLEAAYY